MLVILYGSLTNKHPLLYIGNNSEVNAVGLSIDRINVKTR